MNRTAPLAGIGVLAVAILAVFGLTTLLNRTSLGHQMQAAAQNPTVARIIGVPVERMILLTFLINAFLVALASLLITPIYLAKFSSGEVLGQRPMSQNRGSLVKVQDLSGFVDLIVRPLSQKLLPDTLPIRAGWVDKAALLGLNGRTRNAQFDLAAEFGVTYPAPASGCLLTDRNYTLRLRELVDHGQADPANISLLRWGRHFRLSEEVKLVVGRDEADNTGLESAAFPGLQLELRDLDGPLGLLTTSSPPPEILELAASILLHYSRKAPSPGYVKYGIDNNWDREILVEKCPEATLRGLIIALD